VSCEKRKGRTNVKEKGGKREKRGEREMLVNAAWKVKLKAVDPKGR